MSDLLNKASLVMVPSGYKEDTVYSVIPTDGSGDLSFTRASNGTRVNSAGLVEVCPWNLAQQSNTFGTSPWSNTLDTGATLTYTANYGTAPDGTTTAGRLQMALNGSAYAQKNQIISVITGQQYTYSVYMRSLSGTKTIIFCYDNTNNISATVTTEWQRFTHTFTGNSQVYARFVLEAGTSTSVDLLIYGAQLNIGSTAKPYFPTTDRLNVPRLTYQNGGGGCPSLLLEKQSTNVATQSTITSFGSGTNDWLNGAGSPASINQTTGIDGTQNGTKYTRTAGQTTDDYFYKNTVPVTSGTTYTVSGYIKLGTASNAVVVINNTSAWNSVPNGSIVCSTANGFSTTAWKRFELTITGPSTNQINIHYGYHQETGVTAQATGTFFLDGLQVEASSYATSLIPTLSSSATRVADACSKTGISSLIGQTEGVVFADFVWEGSTTGGADYPLSIYASSYSDFVGLNTYENTNSMYVYVGGSNVVAIAGTTFVNGQRYKIAMAYKSNDFVYYLNGTQMGADTSGSVPSSMANFQTVTPFAGKSTSQKYNEIILFPTRLTNAELASLTTI